MPACLAALDHDRVDAHARELARKAERRRKAEDARTALFDPGNSGSAGQASGEHDVSDPVLGAYIDQIEQLRVKRYQVHAERLSGQLPRRANLGDEEFRRHGS
jgi:hypothetical protein